MAAGKWFGKRWFGVFAMVAVLAGCVANPARLDSKYDDAIVITQDGVAMKANSGVFRLRNKPFTIVTKYSKKYRVSVFATAVDNPYSPQRPLEDKVILAPATGMACPEGVLCTSDGPLRMETQENVKASGKVAGAGKAGIKSFDALANMFGANVPVVVSGRNYTNVNHLLRGETIGYTVKKIDNTPVEDLENKEYWVLVFWEQQMGEARTLTFNPAAVTPYRVQIGRK